VKIVADKNIPFVQDCFAHLGDVEVFNGREINGQTVARADALLVRSVTGVDEFLLKDSPVQFVGTATIGFEHVDCAYLAQRGIGFSSAPGSNANSVAEYVCAALLDIGWKKDITLTEASIGIIGVGNVGSRVAAKCKALGMRVVLNDPPLARQTGDAKYRPLDEVYGCDFVTIHTPLTREGPDKTFHMADAAFFSSLKPGAVFINTARGSVMDTRALKAALKADTLAAVCLDVWENEPSIDPELLRMVDLSTPHIAGYSFDGKVAGLIMIYEALCRHFAVSARHTPQDFLPAPDVPEVQVDVLEDEQETLRRTVQQVYVINRDDFNTREILMVPESERGAFFDSLRKNYPRRREFQNTRVSLNGSHRRLREKLAGIGFHVT